MFENVIGHKKIISSLKSEITTASLPPSILIAGSSFSGKLTLALEIARALTCQKKGEWNCDCPSCRENRSITQPDILLFGRKEGILEIRAAKDVLLKNKNLQSYYLFLRSVRKLTCRFDQNLFDSQDATFIKAATILPDIEEALSELKPQNIETFDDKKLKTLVSNLEKKCEKLQDECMQEAIPIAQVRAAISWVHLKASNKRKVLIIEGADAMQEGARNALLKTLEEPPSYANFILTTQNKNAIMPTILSRTRVYELQKREAKEEESVLRRVFAQKDLPEEDSSFSLLSSFFYRYLSVNYNAIREAARLFWICASFSKRAKSSSFALLRESLSSFSEEAKGKTNISYIVSSLNKFKPRTIYTLFLKELVNVLRTITISASPSIQEIKAYKVATRAIEEARIKVERFNMQVQNVMEELLETIISI